MFLFIWEDKQNAFFIMKFKYISCSYLSKSSRINITFSKNLNTSHVLIYPTNSLISPSCFAYLNTSHVLIYQKAGVNTEIAFSGNLNTSHVLIYRL